MGKIIAVKENFLPNEFNKRLQSLLESNNLAWYFEPRSLSTVNDGNFMFTHSLFNRKNNHESKWLKLFDPILYFIADIISFRDCARMKMNCYPNRGKIYEHAKHVDILDPLTEKPIDGLITCVYNFTTCNGYTIIGDEKFMSKQNQIIIFDGDIKHCGATATDVEKRIMLNINLVK